MSILILAALLPAASASGQTCQAPGVSTQGEHYGKNPGWDLITIRPCGFQPMVAGMEFMPNGDLLILTWRGQTGPRADGTPPTVASYGTTTKGLPTKARTLFRLSKDVRGRDNAAVTFKEVGDESWFKDPQGLVRVGNDLYVGDLHQIVKLVDANNDGTYESVQKIGDLPDGHGWFEYTFGPVHKDGYLYVGQAGGVLSTGWPTKQLVNDNSSVLRMPIGGGKYEVVAEGLRAPDGIGIGPDGEVFTTDNQGSYRPASRVDHIVQGRWYGYVSDPAGPLQVAAKDNWTRPAIWGVYNDIDQSMTEPWLLQNGPYKGHMLIGDNSEGGVIRAYLEKVGGEYQGGLVAFSGALEGPVHRIREDDQGHIYLGMVGNGGDGNQGWAGRIMGLQKLIRNAAPIMEIYAAYSREGGMEIEFTQAVGADAAKAANFTIRQWKNDPVVQYGSGHKNQNVSLAVSGTPQLCSGNKRVFIPISGLLADRTVHISVAGVTSADGKGLFTKDTWYTLNKISTAKACSDPSGTREGDPVKAVRGLWTERVGSHALRVNLPDGEYRVEVVAMDGRTLVFGQGARGSITLSHERLGVGIQFLRITGQGRNIVRPLTM